MSHCNFLSSYVKLSGIWRQLFIFPRIFSSPVETNLDCFFLVTQSCLTLCDPMDCSLPGSSVHGASPCKNTRVGCHALLQGIFPTQGSNPGFLQCKWLLYHLSNQGSTRWVAYSFSGRSSQPWNLNRGSAACRQILYWLSYQVSQVD